MARDRGADDVIANEEWNYGRNRNREQPLRGRTAKTKNGLAIAANGGWGPTASARGAEDGTAAAAGTGSGLVNHVNRLANRVLISRHFTSREPVRIWWRERGDKGSLITTLIISRCVFIWPIGVRE